MAYNSLLSCYDMLTTEVEEHAENSKLTLYPNPCKDATRLRYTIKDTRYLISDLFSISGLKVKRLLNEKEIAGEHELEIDMSDLPAGVYFCTLKTNEGIQTKKLIKVE